MADRITSMPVATILDDGSLIELEFRSDTGNRITLALDPDDFEKFISRAVQLVTGARTQKLASGDHREVEFVLAVAASAQTTVGGSRVLLSVRSNTGLLYHFSLPLEEAEWLRPELSRAIRSAKEKRASQSRH